MIEIHLLAIYVNHLAQEFMTDQSARLQRRDAIRVVDIQRTSLLLITKRLHPSPPRCRGLIEGAISVYPIQREC